MEGQVLTIKKLGPVQECTLRINDYIVLMGPQAAGKSTIAKSVFFFKNMVNVLYGIFVKIRSGNTEEELNLSLKNRFFREIRKTFMQIFGTTWNMDLEMQIEYCFSREKRISVSLKDSDDQPNYLYIQLSSELENELKAIENNIDSWPLSEIRSKCETIFEERRDLIYIPAGRSMITLLSSQINYLYSVMDDRQKRSLDYCTQNYLERMLQMKDVFQTSPEQMIADQKAISDQKMDLEVLKLAADYIRRILRGEYRSYNGEERLILSEDKYVKINFASSGQQEAVWILNLLFYEMLMGRRAYFIIEEPESHLYPDTQKLITEYISLVRRLGSSVLVTTHSPYVLGTINNQLYAGRLSTVVDKGKLREILNEQIWLNYDKLDAYHVNKGSLSSCKDHEMRSIENEVIDGASEKINNDFDKMVRMKEGITA